MTSLTAFPLTVLLLYLTGHLSAVQPEQDPVTIPCTQMEWDSLFQDSVCVETLPDQALRSYAAVSRYVHAFQPDPEDLAGNLVRREHLSGTVRLVIDTLGHPCCLRTPTGREPNTLEKRVYQRIQEAPGWEAAVCGQRKYPWRVDFRYHF